MWPQYLIKVGNTLFFTDYDSTNGTELWKSDGTASGTTVVKDINPGGGDSNPGYLTDVNGTLYFTANDGTHGSELWKSDGTESGTAMVKDINPSGDSFLYSQPINASGTFYFSDTDGTNGMELWKSDGTADGTVMVKDINPGSGSSFVQNLTYCNGSVFFTAQAGAMMGSTIYKTDGTASGTIALTLPGMATPNSLFCSGNILYYTANNIGGNTGVELGKTDGTDLGTVLVKDINPGGDSSYPQNFADINGTLYFSATDGTHGQEFWKSDGTSDGTVMIKDINPGSGDSSPTQFFNNGDGTIYFDASDGPHGEELWKTNGTADGTVMVKDINVNNGDSWPSGFTNIYGTIYFYATNVSGGKGGNSKYQLWKTDGTESGTVPVADLNPGGDDGVSNLVNINNTLYFTADDGVNGTQLWTYVPPAPDNTAPTVPGIPQAMIGTNLTSQVWTWTASTDAGSGVKQYDWRVDGGPSGTSTSPTVTTNLTEGNWKFYVKAEDIAGNQSAESSSLLAVMISSIHEIVVDCSVPLIQVAIATGISNPYLDLSPITAPSGELLVANISCAIKLKTILPSAVVAVDIPAGAIIKAPNSAWSNKILIPPVATTTTTTTTTTLLPANSQVALAIIIGHTVAPLEITRGVRIFMEGQAGKKVGYISNNVFTEITDTCADDSQTTGDALAAEGNCKIDSGSDLVIWTKHFSEFITYTIVAVSQNPPSGGGGGMPAEYYNSPKPPAGGFGVSINNGAEYTASPTTILSLRGGSDTAKMVISNSPDFKDAGQENYVTTKIWNLCWKNAILQTPSGCLDGTYTVYAKYYTSWGTASNVVSDTIVIKKLDQTGQNPVVNSINQPFAKNLKLGQTLADVKRLQIFLNQNPDTQIAKFGVGSPGKETTFFGSLTKAAVIKFQEKYTSEILSPLGLKKGTGICAEHTRAKINKLLGF